MNKIEQMKKLIQFLNDASDAYYNSGNSVMSDSEFDSKTEKLQRLEKETNTVFPNSPTINVGATVLKTIPEITHKFPMLSLDKVHSEKEVIEFVNHHDTVASVKMDGLTVRLSYFNGELIRAESRGNGFIGNDVTEAVKQFKNIPLHINKSGEYIIDGEALIRLYDFAEINKNGTYKNPRNLAAGTLASLDTSVVKERKMSWYAWEVVKGSDKTSFYWRLVEAKELGFDVVPFRDGGFCNSEDYYKAIIDNVLLDAQESHLPQDGVVFKFDDVEYGMSLGRTEKFFRNGIAWNAPNESVETTLKDIEWSIGKSGILTPVAVFEPVVIDGSVVERASLHNLTIMRQIMGRPWKGQKIGVFKANLIIPAIRWAEQLTDDMLKIFEKVSFISPPLFCPICGSLVDFKKDNESEVMFCTNSDCKGKILGKLCHAASRNALNIDGLSESTIEKFINLGWLNSTKDIYHLSDYSRRMKTLPGFGKRSADKLLNSIEKSRNTNLERFLYSLSIPLLGKSASKDIANYCKYDFDEFMRNMTLTGANCFKNISGVGDSIIDSMDRYFSKHCSDIFELSKEFKFEKPSEQNNISNLLSGKTFVITGSLQYFTNRDAAKSTIESYGGKVSGSISAKTSYLVCNEDSNSGKSKKAKELGIPIITEEELIEMIGGINRNEIRKH